MMGEAFHMGRGRAIRHRMVRRVSGVVVRRHSGIPSLVSRFIGCPVSTYRVQSVRERNGDTGHRINYDTGDGKPDSGHEKADDT